MQPLLKANLDKNKAYSYSNFNIFKHIYIQVFGTVSSLQYKCCKRKIASDLIS